MARTIKRGLDYFPMDIDFFQDIRIRKLIKYQSGKAITVYALLLCNIYRNGYYIEWDKELPFIISEQTGYTEAYIQEVIDCCMNIGLFSKELFESAKVLTSKGVQERYANICAATRRKVYISDYCLLQNVRLHRRSQSTDIGKNQVGVDNQKANVPSKPTTKPKSAKQPEASSPRPDTTPQEDAPKTEPPKTEEQPIPLADSISQLKKDADWIERAGIRYSRSPEEICRCLDEFALVCPKDSHPSLQDCRSHFCRWLAKQKPNSANQQSCEGVNPKSVRKISKNRIDSTKEYLDELERHKAKACTPAEYIRSKGYDPNVVTMANLRDEKWLAQNPPTIKS